MEEDKYPSYFTANVIIYNDEFINYVEMNLQKIVRMKWKLAVYLIV